MLPLILALAVFFISCGVSVPNHHGAQEAKLSKLQNAKPGTYDVVQSQVKAPQSRTVAPAQLFVRCNHVGAPRIPFLHLSVSRYEFHLVASVLDSAFPPRAPPA
jgi:hypothetical protein